MKIKSISIMSHNTLDFELNEAKPITIFRGKHSGLVLDLMRELANEKMTMVIVTHEMGFAREVGSRVIFMNDGNIAADGTPDEIFNNPAHPRLKEFLSKIL